MAQNFNTVPPAPPCANDPVGGNVSALVGMANGAVKGSDSAGGNQSVLSGMANGSQEHGKAKHNTG